MGNLSQSSGWVTCFRPDACAFTAANATPIKAKNNALKRLIALGCNVTLTPLAAACPVTFVQSRLLAFEAERVCSALPVKGVLAKCHLDRAFQEVQDP
jgi:hypothetical protein